MNYPVISAASVAPQDVFLFAKARKSMQVILLPQKCHGMSLKHGTGRTILRSSLPSIAVPVICTPLIVGIVAKPINLSSFLPPFALAYR